MEQEPVYVPSKKLVEVCEAVLVKIYDHRQDARVQYVQQRTDAHNNGVRQRNRNRALTIKFFGAQPEYLITPQGMEQMIAAEVAALQPEVAVNHPMVQIHRQYGQLEHEAKDAIIMAGLTDSIPISADFCRGVSHFGIDPQYMRRMPFGFHPAKCT